MFLEEFGISLVISYIKRRKSLPLYKPAIATDRTIKAENVSGQSSSHSTNSANGEMQFETFNYTSNYDNTIKLLWHVQIVRNMYVKFKSHFNALTLKIEHTYNFISYSYIFNVYLLHVPFSYWFSFKSTLGHYDPQRLQVRNMFKKKTVRIYIYNNIFLYLMVNVY